MTKLYHKYHNQQPNIVAQFNTITRIALGIFKSSEGVNKIIKGNVEF